MSKKSATEFTQKIRLAINTALHNCLRSATPNVCALAETKEGYEQLEKQIIQLCVQQGITPAQAIPLIESEYNNGE